MSLDFRSLGKVSAFTPGDGYAATMLVTGSTAPSASHPGFRLIRYNIMNTGPSTVFMQVFDGYAAPATNANPLDVVQIAAGATAVFDGSNFNGICCSKGIVLVSSSSNYRYVPIATPYLWGSIFFIAG